MKSVAKTLIVGGSDLVPGWVLGAGRAVRGEHGQHFPRRGQVQTPPSRTSVHAPGWLHWAGEAPRKLLNSSRYGLRHKLKKRSACVKVIKRDKLVLPRLDSYMGRSRPKIKLLS